MGRKTRVTRPLRADSRERPALTLTLDSTDKRRARTGSANADALSLPDLKDGVSRGKLDENNTACSHEHGAEFFQTFHDVLYGQYTDSYGTAIRMMMSDFLKRAQKEGLKLSRNEVRDADREVSIEREVSDSTDFADTIKEAVA